MYIHINNRYTDRTLCTKGPFKWQTRFFLSHGEHSTYCTHNMSKELRLVWQLYNLLLIGFTKLSKIMHFVAFSSSNNHCYKQTKSACTELVPYQSTENKPSAGVSYIAAKFIVFRKYRSALFMFKHLSFFSVTRITIQRSTS